MKQLYVFIEGLLNRSNKTKAGENPAELYKEIHTQDYGDVIWDPSSKSLTMEGKYVNNVDYRHVEFLSKMPGITVNIGWFYPGKPVYSSWTDDGKDFDINFNINANREVNFDITNTLKGIRVHNCEIDAGGNGIEFTSNKDIVFENTKLKGTGKFRYQSLKIRCCADCKPIFKNMEIEGLHIQMIVPAWKKDFDKIKKKMKDGKDPGNLVKFFGIDGITKDDLDKQNYPHICILTPNRPFGKCRDAIYFQHIKPASTINYIKQGNWYIFIRKI